MTGVILEGDSLERLRELPDRSVHMVVTSPPYFGLRDYGTGTWEGGDPDCDHVSHRIRTGDSLAAFSANLKGGGHKAGAEDKVVRFTSQCGKCGAVREDRQLGLEPTPEEYVDAMVALFREVRRVLRDDGTLWLNIGDSYAGSWGNYGGGNRGKGSQREITVGSSAVSRAYESKEKWRPPTSNKLDGIKNKELIGIPWMLAFALRADGWYLRQDIIWSKPNPMPESVRDRCTKAHEYLFLLTKSPRYFYDAEAVKEPMADSSLARVAQPNLANQVGSARAHAGAKTNGNIKPAGDFASGKRNKRSVWTISTKPFKEAHFATFPPDLVEPCILAGTSAAGVCARCGEPRKRIVEKQQVGDGGKAGKSAFRGQGSNREGETRAANREGRDMGQTLSATATVGWEPGCDCAARMVPATVLDPFFGAGTTGLVAEQLDRRWIGCELNPEYVEIARRRIAAAMVPDKRAAYRVLALAIAA
jgi:DNA modification methylase